MASPRIPHSPRTLAIALYALASLLAGTAHGHAKPGRSAAASQPLPLAADGLPDGSLPVPCPIGKHGDDAPAHPRPACDACVLSAAHGLPPLSPSVAIVRRGERITAPPAPYRPLARTAGGANRARAPPSPHPG